MTTPANQPTNQPLQDNLRISGDPIVNFNLFEEKEKKRKETAAAATKAESQGDIRNLTLVQQ